MNRSRIATLGILFIFLVVNVIPVVAAGTTAKVTVDNKTGSAAKITLWGPYYYSFDLRMGKNRFEIEKGTYNYSFYACGRYYYGTFKANRTGAKLELECISAAEAAGTLPLKVNNRTGNEFVLKLTGDGFYWLTVKPGVNVFQVKLGTYTYSHNACGEEETGKLIVKGKKGVSLNLNRCKVSKEKTAAKGIRIKIVNQTGGTMTLYLRGDTYLTFTLPPGNTQIQVPSGSYSYTMVTPCGTAYGTLNVRKPIKWTWTCK